MLMMILSKGYYKTTALRTNLSTIDLKNTYFLVEGFQSFCSISTILRINYIL